MEGSSAHNNMAPQTAIEPNNTTNSTASSSLMKLPAELRNTIYEYALRTDDGTIEISEQTGIPEPALLLTNKFIRGESLSIFYSQNIVSLLIESYSPSVPLLVHKKQEAVLSKYKYKITTSCVTLNGPANWHNLMAWLRHFHEADGPVAFITLAPLLNTGKHEPGAKEADKESTVLAGLFEMVSYMDDVHWDRVEETLGMMRYALAAFDWDWDDRKVSV